MTAFLWDRYSPRGNDGSGSPTSVLPALRAGAGREPGSVVSMWPHLTQLDPAGRLTRQVRAEHICLVLFGIHQQGVTVRVHQPDRTFAQALRALRESERFSQDALDERFLRAVGSDQITETEHHLRGLVMQLRAAPGLGFNYTRLFDDLCRLQNESDAAGVRRRWGAAYFTSIPVTEPSPKEANA